MARKSSALDSRFAQVSAACADEISRFNAAVAAGAVAILPTFAGPYRISQMRSDFWAIGYKPEYFGQYMYQSSWCMCNDGAWADLLRQAGVERHPLFA